MRDSIIITGMSSMEKNVRHDITMFQRNLTMVRTRIDAIESALFLGRWTLLRAVLLSIWNPGQLRAEVDKWHEWHIRDYQNKLNEAKANQ